MNRAARCFVAVALIGAALVCTLAVSDVAREPVFLFYLAAVMSVALYAGGEAGALALVLSGLAMVYGQVLPGHHWDRGDSVRFMLHVGLGAVAVLLASQSRRAREQLRKEKQRLALAFEAANAWYWEWDLRRDGGGSRQDSSERGECPVDAVATTFYQMLSQVHADDRERTLRRVRECAATAADYDDVVRMFAADGSLRWIAFKARVYCDNTGQPVRMLGVGIDITHEHEAEDALRASQKNFALAQSAAKLGTWEWDLRSNRLTWSDDMMAAHGFAPQEFDRRFETWFNTVCAEDRQRVESEFSRSITLLADFDAEYRIVWPDGSLHWISARGQSFRDHSGAAVRMAGVALDITERKRAEEEIRNQQYWLSTLINAGPDFIVLKDADGRWMIASERGLQLFALEGVEYRGKSDIELGAQSEFYRDALLQCRASDEVAWRNGRETCCEETIKGPDGSPRIFDTVKIPLFNPDKTRKGLVVIKREITDRRLLEDQLRQAQKMEAVGQLAGGIAHDFNNLLNVIIGYTELMSYRLAPDDPLVGNVEQVLKAADQATALIQQLLAFGRKQVLAPKVLDLNSILEDMGKILPRVLGDDIELMLRPCQQLAAVKADPGQIEQVILNLAINSRDAMPGGGRLVIATQNLDITADRRPHEGVPPGRYVALSVSDSGCGISPDIQARIFEPFFTTKQVGKGTGLGLATAYGIVRQSDGYIHLDSKVGDGTTFTIYLPRTEAAVERAAAPPSSAGSWYGSETVLVVEDAPGIREMLGEFLRSQGYTVLTASNGAEAAEIARASRGNIDVVLTDIVMPGISGRELAQQLDAAGEGLNFVYMSGYAEDELINSPLPSGCVFLQKPFTLPALARQLREVLDAKKKPAARTKNQGAA